MPNRNSININNKVTTLRRSSRLLHEKSTKIQKPKLRKNRVCSSPISPSEKTSLNCHFSSKENVSLKKTHDVYPEKIRKINSVKSIEGSENQVETINGSVKSSRNINGVKGSEGLRRSPRFSNMSNTHELVHKNQGVGEIDYVNGESDGIKHGFLIDFSDKEDSSVVTQKGNSGKRRTKSIGVTSFAKIVEKTEVIPKGRNFDRGIVEICDKKKSHRCNENCGIQKLENRSNNTHLNSPPSSIESIFPKKTQCVPSKVVRKSVSSNVKLDKSAESSYGSRKSNGKIDRVEGIQGPRRSSRFSHLEIFDENSRENMSDGVNRNKTRSTHHVLADLSDKEISLEETKEGNSENQRTIVLGLMAASSKEYKRKMNGERRATSVIFPATTPKGWGEKKRNINKGLEEIRDERRNNECEKNCDLQGWTKDQEVALKRAYFAAKPSPHFWKKVSKMVPGKSAQECFDKVHSEFSTPPQPRPRSRSNRLNLSPLGHFSYSGSKVLLEPTEPNVKRPRSNKQKKFLLQKTVRHLLQKHYVVDQSHEADLFSVFEPTMNSSTLALPQTKILSTPECPSEKQGFLKECYKRSLSAHKKNPLSRIGVCQTALVSPPVLKPIKNMALHEKYLDQLLRREAKRNCISAKEDDRKESKNVQKMDVIKAARNTLVSEARDLINQFKHLQANATSSYEDFDDDDGYGEGEDEL